MLNEILKKHNLELIDKFEIPDYDSEYYSVRSLNTSENYILKCSVKNLNTEVNNSEAEVKFLKKFQRKARYKYIKYSPKIINTGHVADVYYFIFEACKRGRIRLPMTHLGFKTGVFARKTFKDLIHFFIELENLASNTSAVLHKDWGMNESESDLLKCINNDYVISVVGKNTLDKITELYYRKRSILFSNMVPSAGDYLHKRFVISGYHDEMLFSLVGFSFFIRAPITYTAVMIYLLFWRENFWKMKVFSYFYRNICDKNGMNKNVFLEKFRLTLLLLALKMIYELGKNDISVSKDYEDALNSWLYDINVALKGTLPIPQRVRYMVVEEDIKNIAEYYELGEILFCKIFSNGMSNVSARVKTNNGDYIVRVYSDSKNDLQIRKELDIFERLKSANIDTYEIICSPRQNRYEKYPLYGKERNVVVLSYIKGASIKYKWSSSYAHQNVGTTLRQLHEHAVVHGDMSKENVLFIKGKVTGVIDFEWGEITSCTRRKVEDLVRTIMLWLVDKRNKGIDDIEVVRSILIGYYSGALPDRETLNHIIDMIIQSIKNEYYSLHNLDLSESLNDLRFSRTIESMEEIKVNGIA